MTYIKQQYRNDYNDLIDKLVEQLIENGSSNMKPTCGDVNYCLTRIVNSLCPQPYSYTNINNAIGVLECIKLELYRRVAVPYENLKKTQNGDVKEYIMQNYPVDSVSTLGN